MTTCLREPEVLEALSADRLADVRAHLGDCALCRDTVIVAIALRDEHDAALQHAATPTADVVWFRAQLRARAEAAQTAVRPVLVVQALGLACLVGAVAGVVGTGAWWLRSWATWLSSAATAVATASGGMEVSALAVRGVLLALAVWLVIAPVAVYLAATED